MGTVEALERKRERSRQQRKDGRLKRLALIREAKSKPCADCGIQYPYYVMDFDHIDEKTMTIGLDRGSSTGALARLKEEISKCDVVCSNCHRERTQQHIVQSDTGEEV